jgi:hypothetical protein
MSKVLAYDGFVVVFDVSGGVCLMMKVFYSPDLLFGLFLEMFQPANQPLEIERVRVGDRAIICPE